MRKLCFCRNEAPIRNEYEQRMRAAGITPGDKMYVPVGCATCDSTGYKGRVAVYEMLVFTEPVRAAIRAGSPDQEIKAIARSSGMRLLQEDGMEKVNLGLTTIEEVDRVIGNVEDHSVNCSDCDKAVASTFQFCPGCAAPVRGTKQMEEFGNLGGPKRPTLSKYVV